MKPLHALASAIGIEREWRDADGVERVVADASLERIAAALGYPAHEPAAIEQSLERIEAEAEAVPAMLVTEVGAATPLPASLWPAHVTLEDGTRVPGSGWSLPPVQVPGYHRLEIAGHTLTLAVAPRRCPTPDDILPPERRGERLWGPAVQIPALRGASPACNDAYGTFDELAQAVDLFAKSGADMLAINPVHALFAGEGRDYSPYSPSSRLFLNTAFAAPELVGLPELDLPPVASGALIDWENALPRRLAALRALYGGLDAATEERVARDIAALDQDAREALERQALFDALDLHLHAKGKTRGKRGWRHWPEKYHDPQGKAARRFVREHPREIGFAMFVQWLARESLCAVQERAHEAGMAVGLVGDLAVGVHPGGSDAWSMPGAMLEGLTIGAPPDPLGPRGQNWMLSTFSPRGLAAKGYAPWIATLRSALETCGALRIDHAFGMARLWVIPEGAPSSEGAYLTYPFAEMLRLAVLEAHRAGALLIAENLGTAPPGFLPALEQRALLDMRVLWFERAEDEGFIGAADYPSASVAMTGTHDTATMAGWWSGRDLDWAQDLARLPEGTTREEAELRREWDRGLLWACLTHDRSTRPDPEETAAVLEAALDHVGKTPSRLAIVPLEDLLGEREQPNLPGTTDEHPNWRRRLDAPLGALLDEPATQMRIATLAKARKG